MCTSYNLERAFNVTKVCFTLISNLGMAYAASAFIINEPRYMIRSGRADVGRARVEQKLRNSQMIGNVWEGC